LQKFLAVVLLLGVVLNLIIEIWSKNGAAQDSGRFGVVSSWNSLLMTVVGENRSLICVPTAMVDFLSSDGEVAFIMGHEMGHAVDQACKGANKNDMAVRRTCESRADAVGFDLLMKSGFSPYDTGAAFGKLEMYSGDIKTGVQAQLQALGRDHPMTPDRVQHMRDMLTQYNVVLKGPLSKP